MNYIRTKDKIYGSEKWENDPTPSGKNVYYDIDCNAPVIREDDVVGMADTIEELCDVKVAIRKSNHKPYLGHFSGSFWFQEDSGWLGRVDSYEIIYGAIWTDKGLIYVAKMNEKGELELL